MNTRNCSVVAAVMLLSFSTGCSGMKNFLFGRGARCGLCNKISSVVPQFGNTMQAPCGSGAPYVAAPNYAQPNYAQPNYAQPNYAQPSCQAPTWAAPGYGAVAAPSAGCGCNNYADYSQNYDPGSYTSGNCGSCGEVYGGSCGCGEGQYGPVVSDPYLSSGEVIGTSVPYGEQIIGERVIGEQVIGGQTYPGTTYPGTTYPSTSVPSSTMPPPSGDNFNARKFDTDGNKILWEEPLPQGNSSI